jgi:undecaprenyl-diphosphatase
MLKPYRLVIFLAIMTVAIGNPMIYIFKDFFARPRPWAVYADINSLYYVTGLSFPSGHAFQAFAATLPLILCFLTNNETFKRSRKKVVLASLLLFFAINLALSRIFVGVHFLSDVLVGIGFAIILMVILASLLEWLLKTGRLNLQNEKWYAFVFVTLMLFNMIL